MSHPAHLQQFVFTNKSLLFSKQVPRNANGSLGIGLNRSNVALGVRASALAAGVRVWDRVIAIDGRAIGTCQFVDVLASLPQKPSHMLMLMRHAKAQQLGASPSDAPPVPLVTAAPKTTPAPAATPASAETPAPLSTQAMFFAKSSQSILEEQGQANEAEAAWEEDFASHETIGSAEVHAQAAAARQLIQHAPQKQPLASSTDHGMGASMDDGTQVPTEEAAAANSPARLNSASCSQLVEQGASPSDAFPFMAVAARDDAEPLVATNSVEEPSHAPPSTAAASVTFDKSSVVERTYSSHTADVITPARAAPPAADDPQVLLALSPMDEERHRHRSYYSHNLCTPPRGCGFRSVSPLCHSPNGPVSSPASVIGPPRPDDSVPVFMVPEGIGPDDRMAVLV